MLFFFDDAINAICEAGQMTFPFIEAAAEFAVDNASDQILMSFIV